MWEHTKAENAQPRLSFPKVCKQGLHLDKHLGRKMGLRVGREGHMSLYGKAQGKG